jgi:hypothetical protein
MRRWKWLAAVGFALVLGAPAWAQRAVTFGGVDPTAILFQPVDTTNSVVPIARPQTLQYTGFSLKDILPHVGLPGSSLTHGQSVFPTPQNMPGPNYLQAFGFQQPYAARPRRSILLTLFGF